MPQMFPSSFTTVYMICMMFFFFHSFIIYWQLILSVNEDMNNSNSTKKFSKLIFTW